ncbi:MAG: phytanoyl-CoA dioxygenase family protein, partial [Anaerolineae bacterium]|nr:phytanoyl-CoA dioxygenase family protein [Anaerolineae bacterium]
MVQADIRLNADHVYPTITAEQVAFYRENGYLVVEGAMSMAEVEELRAETVSLCRGERGELRRGYSHTPDETDDEVISKYLCIHFPHKVSDIMLKHLAHPVIVDVLTKVISPNVKCMQSMLFIKSAGKPGQAWHQDEDYIPTRDRSLTGAWMALDDATV